MLKYDLWGPERDAQAILKEKMVWNSSFSLNTANNTFSAWDNTRQADSRQDQTKQNRWGMVRDGPLSRKQLHQHLQPTPLWPHLLKCILHVPLTPHPYIYTRRVIGALLRDILPVSGEQPKRRHSCETYFAKGNESSNEKSLSVSTL